MKKIQCPGNPLAQDYSRREFLYVGMLGSLGLTLPQFLKMEAQGAQKFYETREGVAKSVINIFPPRWCRPSGDLRSQVSCSDRVPWSHGNG